MQGSIVIDRAVYLKWWNATSTANIARVYLKKGHDPTVVRRRIIEALSEKDTCWCSPMQKYGIGF
jgi:hypothetical protein